jgi:hypothetical protein
MIKPPSDPALAAEDNLRKSTWERQGEYSQKGGLQAQKTGKTGAVWKMGNNLLSVADTRAGL